MQVLAGDLAHRPARRRVAHAHAAVRLLDRLDLGAKRDVLDLARQRLLEVVGAADDLEHRRLRRVLGRQVAPEAGLRQILEWHRRPHHPGIGAYARRLDVAAAPGAGVVQVWRQPALLPDPLDHPLAIVLAERPIDGVGGHRLRQQLRGVAAPVSPQLPHPQPLRRHRRGAVVHVGRVVGGVERLDRDAELTAVVERRRVVMRDSHRAGVVIQVRIERRLLWRNPDLLADEAAAHGRAPAARARSCLEHFAVVPELLQLVRRGQACEPGAEDDDASARRSPLGGRAPRRQRLGREAETSHRADHAGGAAGPANPFEECSSRDAHVGTPSGINNPVRRRTPAARHRR